MASPEEQPLPSRPRPRLEGIQACRGIAALMVVAFHLTGLSERYLARSFAGGWFEFGWAGVDLFFVLSGFIITFIHGRDLGRPEKLRPYAWRRFARIYPLYALLTLAVVPIYAMGFGEAAKRDPSVIVRSFLLLPQLPGIFPVITVGWSLSFEALFYAIFALLIVLPRRPARALLGSWMALSAASAVVIALRGPGFVLAHPNLGFLLDGRNLEFGLGCASGWVLTRRPEAARVGVAALIAGGLLWLGAAANDHVRWTYITSVRVGWFGAAAAFVVFGVAALDLSRRPRLPRALTYVGDASYSIYLTHGLALVGLTPLAARVGLVARLGAVPAQLLILVVAVSIGLACYQLVERPLLRWMTAARPLGSRAATVDAISPASRAAGAPAAET